MSKFSQIFLKCPTCKSRIDECNSFVDVDCQYCEICTTEFETQDHEYPNDSDEADPDGSDEIDVALQYEDA